LAQRRGSTFDPFEARIDFGPKYIHDIIQTRTLRPEDEGLTEIPID